ncbi:hypothetical protein KO561_02935 [Radiobacillus kanasensis]|uniref:hypothetical protein n=1 Tax=Radiobacillus kanasensis TaxID=2844358 RepID=UPI001E39C8B2|nr:hypothetical protein [Radiobacillus kanasensis]UFT99935.1 hypothetical protein KO561_02935 [Radiobacillus kanasensis]
MSNIKKVNSVKVMMDKVNFESNNLGENFWGAKRSKSPEEYKLGSPIDSKSNVYNIGAIIFGLLGGEMDHSLSKWEANQNLFQVARKAVEKERDKRYSSIKEFYHAWKVALKQKFL